MTFAPSQRTKLFLRMALDGAEGSGKSYTAMKLMYYLLGGAEFFLIDSERGRSRLYACAPGETADPEKGRFEFQSLELTDYDPRNYIAAIRGAVNAGAKGLVIDGISQGWEGANGILAQKTALDKRPNTNSYTNWGTMTDLQNEFIGVMLDAPLHLIVTMRSKVDHIIEKNENGKTIIRKLGLQPIQRDGVGYEFDVIGRMEDSRMSITKVRNIDSLIGKEFDKPGLEVAQALNNWLGIGAEMPMTKEQYRSEMQALGYKTDTEIAEFGKKHPDIVGAYRLNELLKRVQR